MDQSRQQHQHRSVRQTSSSTQPVFLTLLPNSKEPSNMPPTTRSKTSVPLPQQTNKRPSSNQPETVVARSEKASKKELEYGIDTVMAMKAKPLWPHWIDDSSLLLLAGTWKSSFRAWVSLLVWLGASLFNEAIVIVDHMNHLGFHDIIDAGAKSPTFFTNIFHASQRINTGECNFWHVWIG